MTDLEIKIEKKLAERRSEELSSAIRGLTSMLKKDDESDSKVLAALNENNQNINVFLAKVQELSSPSEDADDELNELVKGMKESFDKMAQKLTEKKEPAEWIFDVKRNPYGMIDVVIAKQK